MKVIDGGFGKTDEGEQQMTMLEVCAHVLNYMDIADLETDDDTNLLLIIDTPQGFTVTASYPELNYLLATLSKATHLTTAMAMEGDE